MDTSAHPTYFWGKYQLRVGERVLLKEGHPVSLTPKAFDLLLVLAGNAGRTLSKGELLRQVWPGTSVDPSNLSQHIFWIRKALGGKGDDNQFIETVPKVGYRFVAPLGPIGPGAALAPDLEQGLETPTVSAGKSSAAARHGSILAQRRMRWLGAGGVAVCLGLAILFFYPRHSRTELVAPALTPVRAIAVLPFRPAGRTANAEYLGLGLADAVITRLGNLRQLEVRPTSSIRKFSGSNRDPASAGRALRVDAVLDGSFQQAGQRIRVTAQLLDTRDGSPIWMEEFDEPSADLFLLEDEIARRLAGALALRLAPEEKARLAKRSTADPAAYQAYLKGRYFWSKRTSAGLRKAIAYFREAIAADPGYARAYAGLADSYSLLSLYSEAPSGESIAEAERAAEKAVALDESLPEAHTSLAYVKQREWNWKGAEREFRRAIELGPGYATAHEWFGETLRYLGRQKEAQAEAQCALELDPVSPIVSMEAAMPYYYGRQYGRAIEQLQKTMDLDWNFAVAHGVLAYIYAEQRRYDQAISEYEKAASLKNSSWVEGGLAYVYAKSGQRQEALSDLRELLETSRHTDAVTCSVALAYLGLGNEPRTLDWFERAYREHNDCLLNIAVDPMFDPLRSNPRFQQLVRKIGLSD